MSNEKLDSGIIYSVSHAEWDALRDHLAFLLGLPSIQGNYNLCRLLCNVFQKVCGITERDARYRYSILTIANSLDDVMQEVIDEIDERYETQIDIAPLEEFVDLIEKLQYVVELGADLSEAVSNIDIFTTHSRIGPPDLLWDLKHGIKIPRKEWNAYVASLLDSIKKNSLDDGLSELLRETDSLVQHFLR